MFGRAEPAVGILHSLGINGPYVLVGVRVCLKLGFEGEGGGEREREILETQGP